MNTKLTYNTTVIDIEIIKKIYRIVISLLNYFILFTYYYKTFTESNNYFQFSKCTEIN